MCNYALVTGAGSGIGFALACCFAREGLGVVAVGTNEARLEKAKQVIEEEYGVPVHCFVFDLAEGGSAGALYRQVQVAGLQVDVLVNNAGFGLVGPAQKIGAVEDAALLAVNVAAPVELCKLFLPGMVQRGRGRVLNVGSTGAFQPGPYTASYFASKAYLVSYTRAIRYELRGSGVKVCALCPGATATGFFAREGMEAPLGAMPAEAVASCGYKALNAGRAVAVPGLHNRLSLLAPQWVRMRVVAGMKGK